MSEIQNSAQYKIAMNIYRALGGQETGFDSVEDVYNAVNGIYEESGGRITIEPLIQKVSSGGVYTYNDENVTGYKPVKFEVDIKEGFNFGVIGYDEQLSDECNDRLYADIAYSKSLYDAWDPSSKSMGNLYYQDKNLVYAPNIDTSNVTLMINAFRDCSNLIVVPLLDTSNVTNMEYTFFKCTSLQVIPYFDTSNVTDMSNTFNGCTKLTTIPRLDTSNVTRMSYTFNDCQSLTDLPLLDTSNVTTMTSIFYNCRSLKIIPQLDTSNVTTMSSAFYGCSVLEAVPLLDTSKVTSVSYMFYYVSDITTLGGFKNLGMQSSLIINNQFLSSCKMLSYESIMNVIDNLYDRAGAGYSVLTIKLHTNVMALLSEEDIAIATAKGWTLTS